jgi:hypothetical protein
VQTAIPTTPRKGRAHDQSSPHLPPEHTEGLVKHNRRQDEECGEDEHQLPKGAVDRYVEQHYCCQRDQEPNNQQEQDACARTSPHDGDESQQDPDHAERERRQGELERDDSRHILPGKFGD